MNYIIIRGHFVRAFFLGLLVLYTSLGQLLGQTHIGTFNIWSSVITDAKVGNRWLLRNELHLRRARGLREWQQQVVRPSVRFTFHKNIAVSLGYTFVRNHPYGERNRPRILPEHNIWEQVTVTHKVGTIRIRHRNRVEHRWLGVASTDGGDGYVVGSFRYANRWRYRFTADAPVLLLNKRLKAVAYHEMFIDLNQRLGIETISLHWTYLGLAWRPGKKMTYAGGLIRQRAKRNKGAVIENNTTLLFTVLLQLND